MQAILVDAFLASLLLTTDASAAPEIAAPQNPIVGKWQGSCQVGGQATRIEIEFKKDGVVVMKVLGSDVVGKYRVLDVHRIEFNWLGQTNEVTYKVSADTLQIVFFPSSDINLSEKYTRIR